jgi:GxxExxY protein
MKAEIYKDEGYRMMGAAFAVYNELGYDLEAEIYRESMAIELELRAIPFQARPELACFYKEREMQKRYSPDLLVFGCLVVELKSVRQLLPEDEARLLNFLHLTRRPVGYLVNFGHQDTLEWKRIILPKYIPPAQSEGSGAD